MAKSQTDTDRTAATAETSGGGGFLRDNVRMLGFIGIGLLVLVGVIAYFMYSRGQSNEKALVELGRIRPYYDRGEYAIAINGDSSKMYGTERVRGLQQIVADYGSDPAGKLAALLLGNSYLGTGEPAKAQEPFEKAASADDGLVTSAAHAGLASVAESANRFEEAAREFERAASEDELEVNTPQYLINAARNYERAGKKEDAIEQYKTVATRFAQSQANAQARLALARHGVEL